MIAPFVSNFPLCVKRCRKVVLAQSSAGTKAMLAAEVVLAQGSVSSVGSVDTR